MGYLEKLIKITYDNKVVYKNPFFIENTSSKDVNIQIDVSREYSHEVNKDTNERH